MGNGVGEVAMSVVHEYDGGTRGSGIVSCATDMIWLIVV